MTNWLNAGTLIYEQDVQNTDLGLVVFHEMEPHSNYPTWNALAIRVEDDPGVRNRQGVPSGTTFSDDTGLVVFRVWLWSWFYVFPM